MHENVPLTIERLSGDHESECRVTSARQINALLLDIADSGSPAALYYDGTKDFIMTSLLGVGDKGFWVEQGTEASINRHIAESKKLTLVSLHKQVKVQFTISGIRAVTHQGYPAFYLPLPAALYRIQRREYFRLAIPSSERLRCFIPTGKVQAGQAEVPIIDISGGGVRLSYAEKDIEFVIGQIYPGCQIDLPEIGKINATLIVRNLVTVSPKPGQEIQRVGCEFKSLENAASVMLQRYVTNMQRLNNDTSPR